MNYDDSQKTVTATRLKECRNEKGLSHEKLAQELRNRYNIKISSAVLKNYEVADKYHTKVEAGYGMNIQYLYTLADFYNVSTEYLLGKTDVKTTNIDIHAIIDKTGLSESVINILMTINIFKDNMFLYPIHFSFTRDFINPFFSNEDFIKKLMNLLPVYFNALVEREVENMEKDYYKENYLTEQVKDNDFFENATKHDVTYDDADINFFLLSRLFEDFIKEFYDDFSKRHLEKMIEKFPDEKQRSHAKEYLKKKAPHLCSIDTTKKGG